MLIRHKPELTEHQVTGPGPGTGRRHLLRAAGLTAAGMVLGGTALAGSELAETAAAGTSAGSPRGKTSTPYRSITTYNNFYEFGTSKADPAAYAGQLVTHPWSVTIGGACHKPAVLAMEDILRRWKTEDRIYRHRCVEGWSMVIPWVGFPLTRLLKQVEPLGSARFVAFQTLLRPSQMPGQRSALLDWPYREGLRLDEAMNDLTLLAVGIDGKALPNQDGAPIRLVVPWKYGFKSIKSIVRITLTEAQPPSTWNTYAPTEYGFYSNVNPNVSRTPWSQRLEHPVGDWLPRETKLFNGYAAQVAGMYAGMDLRRDF
ncbi:MAG TPA: protein-methionine-sulfoxide reductase catalytic subunit MsrP [Acetobacteraceae bacterium]|nr:protein-methionine-sulfoxide reductase catalytic subunit MsrP [Acetobacteraceae bacterium]